MNTLNTLLRLGGARAAILLSVAALLLAAALLVATGCSVPCSSTT